MRFKPGLASLILAMSSSIALSNPSSIAKISASNRCGFNRYDFITSPVGTSCHTDTQTFRKIDLTGFDIAFSDENGTIFATNLKSPELHGINLPFLESVSFCESRGLKLMPITQLLAYAQKTKFPEIFQHRRGGLGLDIWSGSGDSENAYALHLAGEPTIFAYPAVDNSTTPLCFQN